MSKRKHKGGRDTNCMNTTNNRNNANVNNMNNNRATYNNGPFGINPNQLLSSMFGNIDMNQINSLLQSMSKQGFDFNNLNLGNLMGNMGNPMSSDGNINNNSNNQTNQRSKEKGKINSNDENLNKNMNLDINDERNDENIQMLRAIRTIVNGERGKFIDKIITMYNDGIFDD